MKETNTLIIGASAAGLASAACLQKQGIEYIILERQQHVANGWRNHYNRVHLHFGQDGLYFCGFFSYGDVA